MFRVESPRTRREHRLNCRKRRAATPPRPARRSFHTGRSKQRNRRSAATPPRGRSAPCGRGCARAAVLWWTLPQQQK
ncbi:hypothetical protein QQF64_013836 [Cirrhinus molitorella]|uniref:Uncharacterized protein n=1 Tax=Cirrhinus molitorella TaxID=172907 RepID=A0ABR3LTX8_9TELE